VEQDEGIWEFAAGCMRTYLALADKAHRFDDDQEIQEALAQAGVPGLATETLGAYTPELAQELLASEFDTEALANRGYHNDKLDQLVIDLILGLR
ncbi:MAG: xylose isomerase, partial [Acidimicrobiia bacterium]